MMTKNLIQRRSSCEGMCIGGPYDRQFLTHTKSVCEIFIYPNANFSPLNKDASVKTLGEYRHNGTEWMWHAELEEK